MQARSASEERCQAVLGKLRDSNPHGKLQLLWRSTDYHSWQGVRTADGEVTGL